MVFSITMYRNIIATAWFNLATNILAMLIVLVGWMLIEIKIDKQLHERKQRKEKKKQRSLYVEDETREKKS